VNLARYFTRAKQLPEQRERQKLEEYANIKRVSTMWVRIPGMEFKIGGRNPATILP